MIVAVTSSQLSCRRDELARVYKPNRMVCDQDKSATKRKLHYSTGIHLSDINEELGTSASEPHRAVG